MVWIFSLKLLTKRLLCSGISSGLCFFIVLFVFYCSVVGMLWILVHYQVYVMQIFIPVSGLPIDFLCNVFWQSTIFTLMYYNFAKNIMFLAFGIISRKSLHTLRSWKYSLKFSSGHYLAFTLRSEVNLKLICQYALKYNSSYFYADSYSISTVPSGYFSTFVKK